MQFVIVMIYCLLLAAGIASFTKGFIDLYQKRIRPARNRRAFDRGFVCDIIVRDQERPDIYVILIRRDADVSKAFEAYVPCEGQYKTFPPHPEIRRGLPEFMH